VSARGANATLPEWQSGLASGGSNYDLEWQIIMVAAIMTLSADYYGPPLAAGTTEGASTRPGALPAVPAATFSLLVGVGCVAQ